MRPAIDLDRFVDDPNVRKAFTVAAAVIFAFYAWRVAGWQGFHTPPGILVQGTIIGGLTALIAFGLSLVYRANRIINFAQGDLGAVPAVLAVLLIVGPNVPYAVALLAGVAAAVVLGAFVELVIVRRFFRAPRLILTVATIGLAQILIGGGLILPRAFDLELPPQSFRSPFDFSFEIDPIVFRGNDIIAMVAVPIVVAGLIAFFRYTHIGIAVRASAESSDRAFLLGVPVRRINTVVWILAAVLGAVAMFLRAGIVGLPIGSVLGPGILLRALTAAVIGRMERFGVIFGASVVLGMVEQSVVWHTGRSILVDPILFVVILGALLLQRRSEVTRAEDATTSTWRAVATVRKIPAELAKLPEVRWAFAGGAALLGSALLLLPLLVTDDRVNLAGVVVIFAIIGLSLVVLTGWAGQVSLGHMAFVGIGAATGGVLTDHLGADLLISLPVAGAVGAIASAAIGIPALRIRGLLLAVTTLAFALATSSFLLNEEFIGILPTGRIDRLPLLGSIRIDGETGFFYVTLAGLAACLVAVTSLRRGRTGRILMSVRDNERAAASYGVNATRAKLMAFAISGFFAAFAGGLFVHQQQLLQDTPFLPEQSLRVFTMAVIGGLGSVPGAILGAAYIWGTDYFLPRAYRFIASGVGVTLVLMIFPDGLGAIVYRVRDAYLRWVASRRRIIVPSLVADVASDAEIVVSDQGALLREAIEGSVGGNGDRRAPSRTRKQKASVR